MSLPNDPMILLSYVNTQLRDHYPSLDDLCRSLDADREQLASALASIGYAYEPGQNQFV